MKMRHHVQTWTQKSNGRRYDWKFARFALAGSANDAYDIASLDLCRIPHKFVLAFIKSRIGQHLHFDTLSSKIIENQFGASLPNRMDASGYIMYLVLQRFTILKLFAKLLDEFRKRDRYMKFVRIRLIIGIFE